MKQFLKISGKVFLTVLAFIVSCLVSLFIIDKIFPEDVQNLSDLFSFVLLSGMLNLISIAFIWDK